MYVDPGGTHRHGPVVVEHHVGPGGGGERHPQIQEPVPEVRGAELVRPQTRHLQGVEIAEQGVGNHHDRDRAQAGLAPEGIRNGHGMHIGAHAALAPGMCQRFEIWAVVGLIDRIAGSPEPGPERALGTDKAEVAQEMGPDFLAEQDGGNAVHPAVREELGVVSPVVQVRHQRGPEVHVLTREQQLQIVGREPGDAPVVEMEVVVGGTVAMSPRIPERFEDQINLGGFPGRHRNGHRCRKTSEAVSGGDLHLSRRGHRNFDLDHAR